MVDDGKDGVLSISWWKSGDNVTAAVATTD